MSNPELPIPGLPTPEAPSAEAALHGYIDAVFAISGPDSPADEQKLTTLLESQEGIRHFSLVLGKVTLEYDPVVIHKTQIVELLRGAGFPVKEVESSSASAILDAVQPVAEDEPPV